MIFFVNFFLKMGAKFISPQAKKVVISWIFFNVNFLLILILILEVDAKFVSPWSKKIKIGRNNVHNFFSYLNF
jgi:hypothetical protein